jgi:hypothetical protein
MRSTSRVRLFLWLSVLLGCGALHLWTTHVRLARDSKPSPALAQWSVGPTVIDANTPTGYADGRRAWLAPGRSEEAFPWILETQLLVTGGDWRGRRVDHDNAPIGRSNHSPLLYRLWLGIRGVGGSPPERIFPAPGGRACGAVGGSRPQPAFLIFGGLWIGRTWGGTRRVRGRHRLDRSFSARHRVPAGGAGSGRACVGVPCDLPARAGGRPSCGRRDQPAPDLGLVGGGGRAGFVARTRAGAAGRVRRRFRRAGPRVAPPTPRRDPGRGPGCERLAPLGAVRRGDRSRPARAGKPARPAAGAGRTAAPGACPGLAGLGRAAGPPDSLDTNGAATRARFRCNLRRRHRLRTDRAGARVPLLSVDFVRRCARSPRRPAVAVERLGGGQLGRRPGARGRPAHLPRRPSSVGRGRPRGRDLDPARPARTRPRTRPSRSRCCAAVAGPNLDPPQRVCFRRRRSMRPRHGPVCPAGTPATGPAQP